jgi:hypothetical protein
MFSGTSPGRLAQLGLAPLPELALRAHLTERGELVQGIDERIEGALRHPLAERRDQVQDELGALAAQPLLEPASQARHDCKSDRIATKVAPEGQRRQR